MKSLRRNAIGHHISQLIRSTEVSQFEILIFYKRIAIVRAIMYKLTVKLKNVFPYMLAI